MGDSPLSEDEIDALVIGQKIPGTNLEVTEMRRRDGKLKASEFRNLQKGQAMVSGESGAEPQEKKRGGIIRHKEITGNPYGHKPMSSTSKHGHQPQHTMKKPRGA